MYSQGTKGIAQIKCWLQLLVDRTDRDLCMEEDEFAHRIGWTVTRTGFGSRRYRDPRFALLRAGGPGDEHTTSLDNPEAEEVPGNVAA